MQPAPLIQPINIKTEPQRPFIQKNLASRSARSPTKRLAGRKMHINR